MKTRLIIWSIWISFLSYGQTPGFEWAVAANGPGRSEAYAVTTDTNGNIYTTGFFENTVDFDPGTGVFELTSNGNEDIFIQKTDADGHLLWAKQIGENSSVEDIGTAIFTDDYGNVYVAGIFSTTVDFDPGSGVYELSAQGFYDIFMLKLDTDGNFIWAKSLIGSSREYVYDMVLDTSGNILITGKIEGPTDFDPDPNNSHIFQAPGHYDAFVAKYDVDGNYIWAKVFPNTNGNADAAGYGITTDSNNNILITGFFEQTVDFDGGSGQLQLNSIGGKDIFIEKLNAGGDFIWAKQVGGTEHQEAFDIAVDTNNNVLLTGYFRGQTDFDPSLAEYNITAVQGDDFFVEKLDENGNFIWAKAIPDASGIQRGNGITVNSNDEILFTGQSKGIYIEKTTNEGNKIWSVNLNGNGNNTLGKAICIDANDNIITAGILNGTHSVDFDPSDNDFLLTPASSWGNAFVYKLNNTLSGIYDNAVLSGVDIYPNPVTNVLHFRFDKIRTYEIYLFDLTGRELNKITFKGKHYLLSFKKLPEGIYLIRLFDRYQNKVKTIKIQKL